MGLQGSKRSCMRISCVIAATRQSLIRKSLGDWPGLYRGRHRKDACHGCIRLRLRMKANLKPADASFDGIMSRQNCRIGCDGLRPWGSFRSFYGICMFILQSQSDAFPNTSERCNTIHPYIHPDPLAHKSLPFPSDSNSKPAFAIWEHARSPPRRTLARLAPFLQVRNVVLKVSAQRMILRTVSWLGVLREECWLHQLDLKLLRWAVQALRRFRRLLMLI